MPQSPATVDVAAFQAHLLGVFQAAVDADALSVPPGNTLVFTGWVFAGGELLQTGLIELRQAPGLVDFDACRWIEPDLELLPALVLRIARAQLTPPVQ